MSLLYLEFEDGVFVGVLVGVVQDARLDKFDGVHHDGRTGAPGGSDHISSRLPGKSGAQVKILREVALYFGIARYWESFWY